MYINNNISAMNAQRHVFDTNNALNKTLERLSSGLRINSGADDASGLAMAEKMAAQNAGLAVASQNAQDGQALYKTAEGALAQVNMMLSRMEELAVRATNGTLTTSDRDAVTAEMVELRDQINRIANNTEYNTLKLLNGSMEISSSINVTTGAANSIRVTGTSALMKNGTNYQFVLTTAATAAVVSGAAANADASATVSGVISVNGIDIAIASGDIAQTVAGKINAMNASHNVIASVSGGRLFLVSGVLDDEAKYVDNFSVNVLGYALVGSAYTVDLDGNAQILADFGINDPNTNKMSGTNAGGTIDGVLMTVVGGKDGGTRLRDNNIGSNTYGLEVEIDLFNGHSGVYVYNGGTIDENVGAGNLVTHRSAANDSAQISINVDRKLKLHIGANYDQAVYNGIANVTTTNLGIGGSAKFGNLEDIRTDTVENANISLKVIQKAIEDVTAVRSKIGATMNRLDYTIRSIGIQRENLTAAQSRIQDADISMEMTVFTKQQIMLQAGTAMLAQANARPQAVLQLLR